MLYPVLFLAVFLLPGWLIAGIQRCRGPRVLLALGFSYALAALNLLVLQTLHTPPSLFTPLLAAEIAALLLLAGWRRRSTSRPRPPGRAWAALGPGLIVLASVAAYLLWAGPYLEIPADAWEHLRRIQTQMEILRDNDFGPAKKWQLWTTQGQVWYLLQAMLCRWSGLKVLDAAPYAVVMNSLAWTAGIYLFGLKLFAPLRRGRRTKAMAAALATLFYTVSFGVSVFAYMRYYPLAPTMLSYVIYLAAMIFVMDLLRQDAWRWRLAWPPALFFVVLNATHTQEALFVFFMAWSVSLAETVRRWPALRAAALRRPAGVLGLAALLTWLGLFIWSHARPLSPYWVYGAVPIENLLPFLRGMLVQSPTAHFYPVVALWGLWVYFLFARHWREFAPMPLIMAGMAMPLLTVFNPVTMDIMLRHLPDPTALYRFNYLLPLPYVAAWCAVRHRPWAAGGGRRGRRLAGAVVWAGLILFLCPVHCGYFDSSYSRWPTLRKVRPENDWRHWQDMLAMLRSQPESAIITDPVTAYMLRGATRHFIRGQRFDYTEFAWWLRPEIPDLNLDQIRHYLDRDRRWLLVMNLRDGAVSESGRLSGHWPANVLKLGRYYAPRTVKWVEARPESFRLLWERDRVRVYEVKLTPGHP